MNSKLNSKQNLNLIRIFDFKLAYLFVALVCFSSCTTFRGPGSLRVGNETRGGHEEDSGGPGPNVTWTGERRYNRPGEAFSFDWPLDSAKLSRGFLVGGRKSHWGVDLANKKGTGILAAERGVVIYTGKGFRGYGNLIVIEHNDEWATLYAHLSEIDVKEGQIVERGEEIAKMGNTGRSRGVHLHFELRHNKQPVNPLAYLPEGGM